MAITILTKNAVYNTNIDGAREVNFSAGMKSGIVKGALNEGTLFASSSNAISLNTCELIISGHRIVIDEPITHTFTNAPSNATRYSLVAEISVSSSVPTFRTFIQAPTTLRKDNLFASTTGDGIYQLEIGKFTLSTSLVITDIVRTCDVITGGGEAISDIVFNATATQSASGTQPSVNVDYNEETGEFDMQMQIPAGGGSNVKIGDVIQANWDATFADNEKDKSNNASYGAIVHSKEMESYAQPLVNPNRTTSLDNLTYTTLDEFANYFIENYPKPFIVHMGDQENTNFRTVVGNPFSGQNYVVGFITPISFGTTKKHTFYVIYASSAYNQHFAVGFIGIYADNNMSNPPHTHFSGWQRLDA